MAQHEFTACPACGAKLPINKKKRQLRCDYCRNTFVLSKGGGLNRVNIGRTEIREPLIAGEGHSSKDDAMDQIRTAMEEIKQAYHEREQRILQKHTSSDGLAVSGMTAMAILMQFKDKRNSSLLFDRDKFKARFESLSDDDLDFLLNEARKFAVDPKIYDKPATVAFSDDLYQIKQLRAERDQKLSALQASIDQLVRTVKG